MRAYQYQKIEDKLCLYNLWYQAMHQYFTKDEQKQRYKMLKELLEYYLNECNQYTED